MVESGSPPTPDMALRRNNGRYVPQPDSCTATNHIQSDRKLFQSDNSDATKLALLNEFNKSNVGPVKCIVPRWGPSLSSFLTQSLIHCQSFLKDWSPFIC